MARFSARRPVRLISRSGHGRIINIGGVGGHIGVKNRLHVMASKSGLVGLTKGLALELAPGVTANCVVPGMVGGRAG